MMNTNEFDKYDLIIVNGQSVKDIYCDVALPLELELGDDFFEIYKSFSERVLIVQNCEVSDKDFAAVLTNRLAALNAKIKELSRLTKKVDINFELDVIDLEEMRLHHKRIEDLECQVQITNKLILEWIRQS